MLSALGLAALLSTQLNPATTPVPRPDDWWVNRHRNCQEVTKRGGFDVAFLGDSITQGWEGGGRLYWERDFAPLKSANFGFSGDRTEHVLWRLDSGELLPAKPKVVVIMIGTNNIGHNSTNPVQASAGVRQIVQMIRKESPSSKILLLGVFPRGDSPTDSMRVGVQQTTDLFKGVANGKSVHYMDLAPYFTRGDGALRGELMPDKLHLNELGYDVWSRAIRGKVRELLGEPKEALPGGRWENLFDGKTLAGWTQRNGTAAYTVEDGTIVGRTAIGSPNSFLCSTKEYKDFELEFDVKVDNGLNSGVQIRSKTQGGTPTGRVWGPQVEIESGTEQAGWVYGEATPFGWMSAEPELKDPNLNRNAAFRDKEWNHYRVIAQGARIRTFINGLPIADVSHEGVYATHKEGFLGLQVHSIGANEGPYQVAWKNIRVRKLR